MRNSFEHNIAVSDFAAPAAERERMNTIHAAAITNHVSVFRNLEQQGPAVFHLTVVAVRVLDEENASCLVKLDFAIDNSLPAQLPSRKSHYPKRLIVSPSRLATCVPLRGTRDTRLRFNAIDIIVDHPS